MTQVVDINQVLPLERVGRFFIKKMMKVLEKQGQIEPLVVERLFDTERAFPPKSRLPFYTVKNDNHNSHGCEIVFAARELGWKTLLIVVRERT